MLKPRSYTECPAGQFVTRRHCPPEDHTSEVIVAVVPPGAAVRRVVTVICAIAAGVTALSALPTRFTTYAVLTAGPPVPL
ncbi:MAG: hypothetical protein ACRDPY_34915 [Streptosporangiaceae bacterium]